MPAHPRTCHPSPFRARTPAWRTCIAAMLALCACGGSSPSGPDPAASGFAGTYATRVTLAENGCGPVIVQDNPTIVTYQEATRAVTFSHAGTTYAGTVAADSTFTTTPRVVDVGDGYAYTIAIAGRFGPGSFDADATVDRASASSACRYVVHWAATRQGSR